MFHIRWRIRLNSSFASGINKPQTFTVESKTSEAYLFYLDTVGPSLLSQSFKNSLPWVNTPLEEAFMTTHFLQISGQARLTMSVHYHGHDSCHICSAYMVTAMVTALSGSSWNTWKSFYWSPAFLHGASEATDKDFYITIFLSAWRMGLRFREKVTLSKWNTLSPQWQLMVSLLDISSLCRLDYRKQRDTEADHFCHLG